jgi:hypothetical protein
MACNLQNNICVAPFRSWPKTNFMTRISVAKPRGRNGNSDSISYETSALSARGVLKP